MATREGRPRMTAAHWALAVIALTITIASVWLDNMREK